MKEEVHRAMEPKRKPWNRRAGMVTGVFKGEWINDAGPSQCLHTKNEFLPIKN